MSTSSTPAVSPAHCASLSNTAGITAVVTGVAAVALAGQVPAAMTGIAGCFAASAFAGLVLGVAGLYAARNAMGEAMDRQATDPMAAAVLATRALARYHLGMAGVFEVLI